MKLKKLSIATVFLTLAIITSLTLSAFSAMADARKIYDNILRLHIIANSDNDEDQQLKLKVRDAVSKLMEQFYTETQSMDEAEIITKEHLFDIQMTAIDIIAENGFSYPVDISLSECYFSTREYDNIVLPAGKYKALKIIIGDGKGKNWWCMIYPSVCVSGSVKNPDRLNEVLSDGSLELTRKDKDAGGKVKFKIVEVFGSIFGK